MRGKASLDLNDLVLPLFKQVLVVVDPGAEFLRVA
jgi:hypothetical protein